MTTYEGPIRHKLKCTVEALTWLLAVLALDLKARHDLRNALAIVVMYSELFAESADRQLISEGEGALSRAQQVICDVLTHQGRNHHEPAM